MSNELIDLSGLSEFKAKSDLKYQNKLTVGSGISLNNDVISVTPYYSGDLLSGSKSIGTSITQIGTLTLLPGTYYLKFTCQFAQNSNGWRQCQLSGVGFSFSDRRKAVNGATTQTAINAIFQIPATDYPNGITFTFAATSSTSLTAYPRAYYIKF